MTLQDEERRRAEDVFVDHIVEFLQPLGAVRAKRMFGGHGVFAKDRMFGLVADGVLFLKVDDSNARDYEARGLDVFMYQRGGREIAMSYRRAPEEGLDQPEVLVEWARKALAAARRTRRSKS